MRLPRGAQPGSVHIVDSALDEARTLAGAALPKETGGILLGHRRDGEVIVQRFLEVPDEEAGPTRYGRRYASAQAVLDVALTQLRPAFLLGYVGEWHSHPGKAGPSRQDVRELRQSARQTLHPIALIVLCFDGQSWSPGAWIARRRSSRPAEVIELLDGDSEEADRENES